MPRHTGPKKFYIHLVSDASGATLLGMSRAVLAQFAGIEPTARNSWFSKNCLATGNL